MNAVVEVETATIALQANSVVALVVAVYFLVSKALSHVVFTSTTRLLSMGNTSLSAVAPDSIFEREPAYTGA